MNVIVERKDKPILKVMILVIISVFLISFVNFILKKYNKSYPIITDIVYIFMIVTLCSSIIIRFFSKYSYTLEKDQLIFGRIIGSKYYEILKLNLKNIEYIKPYNVEEDKKTDLNYEFVFDREHKEMYVGKFRERGKEFTFLFEPNDEMLNKINRSLKNN